MSVPTVTDSGAPTGPVVPQSIVHRRYVSHDQAHYAGLLVDGAFSLALFGDIATDMCITTDGDEGLFASYSQVTFHSAVRAGDVVEVRCTLTRAGRRSRELAFEARVVARGRPTADAPGAAVTLEEPLVVTTAQGTVVVPG